MLAASQLTPSGIASGLAPFVAARLDADRAAILATATGPVKRLLLAKSLDLLAASPTLQLVLAAVVRGVVDGLKPAAPAVASVLATAELFAPKPQAEYLAALRLLLAGPAPAAAPAETWAAYNR